MAINAARQVSLLVSVVAAVQVWVQVRSRLLAERERVVEGAAHVPLHQGLRVPLAALDVPEDRLLRQCGGVSVSAQVHWVAPSFIADSLSAAAGWSASNLQQSRWTDSIFFPVWLLCGHWFVQRVLLPPAGGGSLASVHFVVALGVVSVQPLGVALLPHLPLSDGRRVVQEAQSLLDAQLHSLLHRLRNALVVGLVVLGRARQGLQ